MLLLVLLLLLLLLYSGVVLLYDDDVAHNTGYPCRRHSVKVASPSSGVNKLHNDIGGISVSVLLLLLLLLSCES